VRQGRGRLLIISNMAHYCRGEELVGWGPTVEEISHVASLFSEVVHIGCLHDGPPPASALPYSCANLSFVPVSPAGGRSLRDKAGILARFPSYARAIRKELPKADAVHVRAPANISLLAMVLLAVVRKPRRRWIKYAGNWQPDRAEPLSYGLQRWILRHNFCRATVTVNGRRTNDRPHVVTFPNPCFSRAEYDRARAAAARKSLEPGRAVTLAFVGVLSSNKGPDVVVDVLARLRAQGVAAHLEMAGDGPMRAELEEQTRALGVERHVDFHGFLPHPHVMALHARAHFVLLPSRSEGWPKVLSEGMAHGAVPIASAVSSIPQVLAEAGCGRALPLREAAAYSAAIEGYMREPRVWEREVRAGADYAARFTYEAHVERVGRVLKEDLNR